MGGGGVVVGLGWWLLLLGVGGVDLGARDAVGGEEVEEVRFAEGEAEGAEGDAEFVVVEVAVAVEVEEGELLGGGGVLFSVSLTVG